MCNSIYFSTDSDENFEQLPRELFRLNPISEEDREAVEGLLQHPRKWYVECRYGGCSCHFRHAGGYSGDPGFRAPDEDEDADNIESTQAVYDLFVRLVGEGFKVDVIDTWNNELGSPTESLTVSLAEVGIEAFTFQEGRRLVLH